MPEFTLDSVRDMLTKCHKCGHNHALVGFPYCTRCGVVQEARVLASLFLPKGEMNEIGKEIQHFRRECKPGFKPRKHSFWKLTRASSERLAYRWNFCPVCGERV